jgi:K319L-like, PKD domain/S-layer homology domain
MFKIQWNLNNRVHKGILIGLLAILTFGANPIGYTYTENVVPNVSNLPPTVSVGTDQTITLADRAFLYGVVSDDNLPIPGAILSVTWSKVSGPGTVTFGHVNDFLTWATFSTTGTYVLRLTASDSQLASSDDFSITVISTAPHTIRVPQDYSTIQAGINAAQNGDLVLVSPGTYTGNLNLAKTITLASTFYTTGNPSFIDQTIISSPTIANPTILVGQLTGPETKIIGFTIKNGDDNIKVHGKVSVFNNKFFTAAADAVDYADAAAGLVMDNYCENNGDDCVDIGNSEVLVEHNQMIANGEGSEIRTSNRAGTQLTIIIRDNFITGSRKTALQLIDIDSISPTTTFILIERNLITNNPQSGLSMMDNGITTEDYRAASLLERIHVFNNTFVGNNYGISGGDNMVVVNNIFANHPGIGVKKVDGNSVLSHNLFWNNGTNNLDSNLDLATTLLANPLLDADYKLQPGSPAINAGVATFTLSSGEMVLNIPPGGYAGAAPDLGKYESNFTTGPTPTPIPTSTSPAPPTTFGDVPANYWAYSWIEQLYNAGITGGCSAIPLMYCPENTVTRAQIAVFLERGMNGSSYTPPPATGTLFADVPPSYWAAAWIEQLASDGITRGCGTGIYCPDNTVTRAQMAVFLLRAKHGSSYTPPTATGMFSDVPTTYWAAAWIEQLAAEGITGGCSIGNYCPESPVSRAQMAVFLVRTFNLP